MLYHDLDRMVRSNWNVGSGHQLTVHLMNALLVITTKINIETALSRSLNIFWIGRQ